jgi:hypothetical protein
MVNVMREEEPLDDETRLHYHRRMIEAMERRRLVDEEIEAIRMVVVEDDEKRARKLHGHFSLTPLFLPTPTSESDHYQWESLNEVMVESGAVASPRRQIVYNLVRAGTFVKIATGKQAGLTGVVVSKWSKKKPQVAKHTVWNVLVHGNKKVVRRMQKSLLLTDTSSGY